MAREYGPLVSCIMPTRGRPEMARAAIECWKSQTYWPMQLVIIDDDDFPSLTPHDATGGGIYYHRLVRRMGIADKRNIAVARSHGEVVAHLDDDDYSAPERIEDQVERLLANEAQVTGYNEMEFRGPTARWMYRAVRPDYAIGTSLMYRKDFWRKHPFQSDSRGAQEDNFFVKVAQENKCIVCVPARGMMWASIHSGNTSPRGLDTAQFQQVTA